MNRKVFCLAAAFVVSAMLALKPGYVQAQTATPSQIARFDPNGAAGACSNAGIDCVDSVITQDPNNGNIGIGTAFPEWPLHLMSTATYGPIFELDASNTAGGKKWFFQSTGGDAFQGQGKLIIRQQTDGLEPMTFNPNGNVRIGPSVPIEGPFTVNSGHSNNLAVVLYGRTGTTGKLRVDTDIPDNVPTYSFDVGAHTGNGRGISFGWDTFSSKRWKTNIQTVHGALEKVEHLRGVSFDWKKDGRHDIGLVAEEVGDVVPEVVNYEENGKDAMSVDYARLTALLIEATKEQQSQIGKLKAEIKALKSLEKRTVELKEKENDAEIAKLKSRLDKLEGMLRNAAYQAAWTRPTE
jgi:hypothetical protein